MRPKFGLYPTAQLHVHLVMSPLLQCGYYLCLISKVFSYEANLSILPSGFTISRFYKPPLDAKQIQLESKVLRVRILYFPPPQYEEMINRQNLFHFFHL